jgi:hypothetical protein
MIFKYLGRITAAASVAVLVTVAFVTPNHAAAQSGDKVLQATEVQKLMPDRVWYKGQAAPSQTRNSGGVKFSDGNYMMATLVDTSGYSSDVQSKYQAYFITEEPLKIGGQSLPAGIYGVGFIGGNKFVVTDVGAHDVFTVDSSNDDSMKRPRPLQVTADPGGGFRLYAGRRYVNFSK